MKSGPVSAKCLAEFLGTLILVFTVACNVHTASFAAAISVGFTFTALIYTLGPVSGGHFNPAISLAVFLVGGIPASDLAYFIASQALGGVCAAALYLGLLGHALLLEPAPLYSNVQAAAIEVIYSSALCYVVLGVTCSYNGYHGFAIGSTVTASSIVAAPISGCCLNPAVALGSIVVAASKHGSSAVHYHWMYLATPFFGAAVAAIFSTLAGNSRSKEVVEEEEPLLMERGLAARPPISYRALEREPLHAPACLSPRDGPVRVVRHEPFRLPFDIVGNDLAFGCRWLMKKDTVRGSPVQTCDVDLACAVFDDQGNCIRGVYFAEKNDSENGLQHMGDEVLGGSPRKSARREPQDNETIKLKLSKMKPNVHALVFTVMIYNGDMSFGDVRDLCVRLVDVTGECREICRYEKKDLMLQANTLIAAMVYRDVLAPSGPMWIFKAVDESYDLPSHSTYRKLIPEMQEHVRAVLPPSQRSPKAGRAV